MIDDAAQDTTAQDGEPGGDSWRIPATAARRDEWCREQERRGRNMYTLAWAYWEQGRAFKPRTAGIHEGC